MPSPPDDAWESAAAYERYVGRWSRRVARDFVGWLAIAPRAAWLDVGCGSGALSETILHWAAPALVVALDRSLPFAAHARAHARGASFGGVVADARRLPVRDAGVDAAVSGLVLNFVPRPDLAVAEMARAARPGGVVGAYVWDYAGRMELLRHFWDAATAVDGAAAPLDEGRRFPMCRPAALAALFRGVGLADVATAAIEIATDFRDFDDYWSPFLGGQGPAPTYVMSLGDDARSRLREAVRARLPFRPDGSILLAARAWAVRGIRAA